ncbi:hypothetical protein B7486_11290 [cyanobacterium TDX16]|nr:hypothetical protein B7486_11290 [cyanobacterium TDX16]
MLGLFAVWVEKRGEAMVGRAHPTGFHRGSGAHPTGLIVRLGRTAQRRKTWEGIPILVGARRESRTSGGSRVKANVLLARGAGMLVVRRQTASRFEGVL